MKILIKTLSFFFLTITFVSCTEDKETLTKEYVLAHLEQCETKKPNVKSYTITKSNYNIPVGMDTTINNPGVREYKHLMKLVKDGYIKSELIFASNANKNYDSYKFSILPKSKTFVLKENRPNTMRFIMYETKAVAVENLEIIDNTKANVTVKYNKIKTPFYIRDYDVSTNLNKSVKTNTYTKTIIFRKSHTNGWIYCQQ